ncbi:MAG: 50S ribosomal protein L29 [Phycisphaerales bacterium]|nr:50S ribosomal protein L29 [Phycisphaerales bacterium]
MTSEELKKMRDEEIGIELKRLREKLFTLRSQAVTEKIEDISQFKKIRRDVARLLTEQRAREMAGA